MDAFNAFHSTRRAFFRSIALGLGAIVLAPFVRLEEAFGQAGAPDPKSSPKPDDALVIALGYVESVAEAEKKMKAKAAGYEKYAKGQNCANCQFYSKLEGAKGRGKCQLIPSAAVNNNGWCKSYIKKA